MTTIGTASIRVLRAEGLVFAAALIFWLWGQGPAWWLVVAVLIAPDLALLAYLGSARFGRLAYNALHSYLGPVALCLVGLLAGSGLTLQIAALWALHCAADRALGYGLKEPEGFHATHLGRIGQAKGDA